MISKYSKKQWLILLVYSVVNTLGAFCISLHGPFYPMVSESKGATPSQYGMVFGAFSLMLFFASPLCGALISRFGVVKISFCGLLIIGITSIMFGFVDRLHGVSLFISISVVIRVLEGLGYAMVRNSGIAIVSCEFSENVEVAFATVQAFTSLGLLIGPVVGGALYELGGFYLPFTVIGVLLMINVFIVLLLPKDYPKNEEKPIKQILILFKEPSVILSMLMIFGSILNASFISVILEPHIKSLRYSPFQVGLIFLCNGISFIFSNLFWSFICEKYNNSWLVCSISCLFIIFGLIILGPAPYLPFDLNIYSCIFGLVIHGIGIGGGQVGGFSTLNKGVVLSGLSQNIQTSGIISMIYTSSLALGAFVGPLLGGIIFEALHLPWGSHIFMLYHIILLLSIVIYNKLCHSNLELRNEETKILPPVEVIGKYKSLESN